MTPCKRTQVPIAIPLRRRFQVARRYSRMACQTDHLADLCQRLRPHRPRDPTVHVIQAVLRTLRPPLPRRPCNHFERPR
jgi:hypothetical protein